MANPTEPFTQEEIDEAVRQARSAWAAALTPQYRNRAIGYWMPFLLARIDQLEARLDKIARLSASTTQDDGRNKPMSEKKPYIKTSPELGDGERGTVMGMDDHDLSVLMDILKDWRDEFQNYEGEGFSLSVVWMTDAAVARLPEL